MHDLPNNKALGIDGFPVGFFKANWDIMGNEVCEAILQFFKSGKLLKQINCTIITLVPKKNKPSYVKDFRPTLFARSLLRS